MPLINIQFVIIVGGHSEGTGCGYVHARPLLYKKGNQERNKQKTRSFKGQRASKKTSDENNAVELKKCDTCEIYDAI